MRRFLTLLDKEWRDARTITAAAALFAGGGVFAVTAMFRSRELPAIAAQYVLPTLAALFAAMTAADLVAPEAQTRRIETTALLPARLLSVWTAKAALLVLLGVGFVAWIVGCQAAALLALRPDEAVVDFAERLPRETWQLGLVALVGCAALFASTLLERGLPSLLVGLGVGAGAMFGAAPLVKKLVAGFDPGHATVGVLALGFAATFAVASAAAFTKGRIHCRGNLRRWVVGFVALVVCLVSARGALAGWTRWSWLAIAPGDDAARIVGLNPRPDGRYVALSVVKWDRERSRWIEGAGRTWVLDIEDGSIREAAVAPAGSWGWDADGRLRVGRRLRDGVVEDVRLDPRTLAETERRVVAERALYDTTGTTPWFSTRWASANGARHGGRTTVTWIERGLSRAFEGWVWCDRRPGILRYMPSPNRLVSHEMTTGEERVLLQGERGLGMPCFSPDGARFLAVVDGEQALFDGATGDRIAGPWPVNAMSWPCGAKSDRFLQRMRAGQPQAAYELVDVGSGRTVGIGSPMAGWMWPPQIVELPDGRLVVLRSDSDIDLLGADLRLVRHLYATHRTEN